MVQILSYCLQGEFNYDKVLKLASDNADGIADIKGSIAAIHFILSNAAKFDVDEKSLVLEIQQLGLPKENSDVIGRQYRDAKDMLRSKFEDGSYRVSKLLAVDWRVDQIVTSSKNGENDSYSGKIANIRLQVDTLPDKSVDGRVVCGKDIAFEILPSKLDVLVHELSHAQSILQNIDS